MAVSLPATDGERGAVQAREGVMEERPPRLHYLATFRHPSEARGKSDIASSNERASLCNYAVPKMAEKFARPPGLERKQQQRRRQD